jgi:hypothetical protein
VQVRLCNLAFDGTPVQIRMDSPFLLLVDPLALDWVREQLAGIKETERANLREVVSGIKEIRTLTSSDDRQIAAGAEGHLVCRSSGSD